METFKTLRAISPGAESVLGKYFPVLDHGFVALMDYMGGDVSIARSARASYGPGTKAASSDENLLRYLVRHRHSSPTEFCELAFHIGMPIFSARQFFRHRTSSINEVSGRYSVMPTLYYTPERGRLAKQSRNNKQGSGEPVTQEEYDSFIDHLSKQRDLTTLDYENWIRNNIARETARINLPLSLYTYFYWKIDLRNLLHLISLRSDKHAQKEIQEYSDIIAAITQLVAPLTFTAFYDYQFRSTTFTEVELKALETYHRLLFITSGPNNKETAVKSANQYLKENGLRERERKEFWDKLALKEQRDFTLDLSKARDASYYEQLALDNAVEVYNEESN